MYVKFYGKKSLMMLICEYLFDNLQVYLLFEPFLFI